MFEKLAFLLTGYLLTSIAVVSDKPGILYGLAAASFFMAAFIEDIENED